MSRLRKILFFFIVSLIGIILTALFLLFMQRERLFAKMVYSANANLYSYGYSLSYEDATIGFFPPRLYLSRVIITDLESGNRVLDAKNSYFSIKPLNLVVPGASPMSLQVEQFRGSAGKKLLSLIAGSHGRGGEKRPKKTIVPTLVLKDGFLEITDPWKYLKEAKLSVKSLFVSGNTREGLGIIYTTGKDGISATVLNDGKEYPLEISELHVNSHILPNKIDVKKIRLNSPYGNVSLSGRYDRNKDELEGQIKGDINTDKVTRDYRIKNFENIIRGGKVTFAGRAVLNKARTYLNIDTEFLNLTVRGLECSGVASCIYDNGNVSLRKLVLNTPVGQLNGDLLFDSINFRGKGEFDIIDFYPGKLTDILFKDSVIGAEGKGNGHITFSSTEKGMVRLQSAILMERGFRLIFRNLGESVEWAEVVALNSESVISNVFQNPKIDVKRLTIADEENQLSLEGNFDVAEQVGLIRGNIDITQVKSLGLKGIFARSGAIRGNFSISGNLSKPLIESSFSLKEVSFRDLPPANIFLEGSGKLGESISVIADYTSTIGNILFTGTYFPDDELYFTGSLKAEKVDIGSFSSENFLDKELHDSLKKRFPIIFPLAGNVSFDGDLALGREKINAKGKLSSDLLRSPKMDLQAVRGDIGYDDDNFVIEDISFKAFGGEIRSRGSFSKNLFELFGNFSNIDPNTLNRIIFDKKQLVSGESLEGAFHVRYSGEEVEKLELHFTSDRISFQDADLEGLIVDGRKKGHKLFLTLSTSNDLIDLELNYDPKVSGLLCTIHLDNFPIKVSDTLFDERLGIFGISISGSAAIGLNDIANLPASLQGILFSTESLEIDFKATPFFTEFEKNLPAFNVAGKRRDATILLEVTSPESEGTIEALFEERGKDDVFLSVQGQVSSGFFPVVLPSKVLAQVKSDLLIDFEGPLMSFPKGSSGRFVLNDMDIEFPGENIRGERVVILFDEGELSIENVSISANRKIFSLSGKVGLSGNVDLLLSGEFDAGLVNAVVTGVFEKITGKVVGDIQIGGKFPDVQVSGQGVGVDIDIKFVGFKHPMENVTTNLTFFKDRILLDSIVANLGGGELEGSGEINILKDAPVNLSFSAEFYGVNLGYPEELPSKIEGSIEFLGPVDGLFLRGELYIERAIYSTPIYPEKFLVDLKKNIERFNAPVGRAFAINLDLECISDGTIFIRNNISEGTAGGSFRLLGDTSRPVIIGTFETIEGEVEFRGTEYTVDRLIVDFDDPLSNNQNIDAFATADKGDYTIFVEVTGRLDNYSVELYSEPPLSKNDIVSLLSLGVTTEAFAENGSSVTTAGLATVALSPLKTQIEEGIRIFTGFERFSVESSYSSVTGVVEPMVVIGKNIGDRSSIDFSTSLVGSVTSVVGEFRLFKDFYFKGDWTGGGTADEGDLGGELLIKKRFHDVSEFVERLLGEESW